MAWIIGIGSGLAAALLALLSREFVWPVIIGLFTREARVAGSYTTHDQWQSTAPRVGEAKVRQLGERITMKVTRDVNRRGEQQAKATHFRYRGRFKGADLNAFYMDTDSPSRSGVIAMHYLPQEQCFKGYTFYFDANGHTNPELNEFSLRKVR